VIGRFGIVTAGFGDRHFCGPQSVKARKQAVCRAPTEQRDALFRLDGFSAEHT